MSRKIEHDHLITTDSNQVSFAKMSLARFRKKLSENGLRTPPRQQKQNMARFEDYRLKAWVSVRFAGSPSLR
jgi:hypothetical protein